MKGESMEEVSQSDLVKGQVYRNQRGDLVTYQGIDRFYGETTYKFKARDGCFDGLNYDYIKPEDFEGRIFKA